MRRFLCRTCFGHWLCCQENGPIKAFTDSILCLWRLKFFIAVAIEVITWQMIVDTAIPLLYAGIMSIGVGYTLQVVAQQHAKSSHAAIILGLEGAFAVLGGWLILDENLSTRGLIGCALMLAGMFLSQLLPRLSFKKAS